MSYEKVQSIKIENDKVFITGKSNNDTEPIKQWHCVYFDQFFKEGIAKVELEILKSFEEGNFQSTADNKWNRALRVLGENPEYAKFNWRGEDYATIKEARQTLPFEHLLLAALNTKLEKQKLIITKKHYDGETIFLSRLTRSGCKWSGYKTEAKIFRYMQDVKRCLSKFAYGNEWNVETI